MVTAIVIPIICIYFYWITTKEMKIKEQEWLMSGSVSEESFLSGRIDCIQYQKQRFYYHLFVLIQNITIRSEGKVTITRKTLPLSKNMCIDKIEQGDIVRVYGKWEKSIFLINRMEKIS